MQQRQVFAANQFSEEKKQAEMRRKEKEVKERQAKTMMLESPVQRLSSVQYLMRKISRA